MATRTLSTEEIRKRLTRLRNLEVLHEAQRFKIWHLRDENRELKKEIQALKLVVGEQQKTIDDLKVQIEELQTIVFGKKKRNTSGDDGPPPAIQKDSEPRSKESYHRPLPREDDITGTEAHPVECCVRCGGAFSERAVKTYFEEDIPLPQKKTVIRHTIEQGYCSSCGTWSAGAPIPSAPVVLGENVKRHVSYLSAVCRQSFSQIEDLLHQSYNFAVSQGEIAKILEREGDRLRPEYERLKAKIRDEPSIHLDETGWNILTKKGERGFAWTMVGGTSKDAVFALGKSRGKGNAEELVGDSTAIRVTDDYAAYRNLRGGHQLSCAHILRKLRDLAQSKEVAGNIGLRCQGAYEVFALIYADIETARVSSDPRSKHGALLERLTAFSKPDRRDPAKLARVKTQVRDRARSYLTCLRHPGVAADNNAAERSLRHLVIKRRISFGSLSERTAGTMAILLSVLLSWKQRGTLRNYLAGA